VIASDFASTYEKPSLRSVRNIEFTESTNEGQGNNEVNGLAFSLDDSEIAFVKNSIVVIAEM
jgi:hypothetical protein